MRYRGRFAPSPTGPLHFGSMVAAVASYLDAQAVGGDWLVRMEDIDEPRSAPGAADEILRTLEKFGLEWDGEVVYQSRRKELYREASEQLKNAGYVYACGCTRRDLEESRYPGTCREGLPAGRTPRCWRVRVPGEAICWTDRLQGPQCGNLAGESGDFVLLRADGFFAYQLAVVADDAAQGITHVVRGADLLDSTPRQLHLQNLLGYPQPEYLHVPVATNESGQKLSKQTRAPAVNAADARDVLTQVLRFLGQEPAESTSVAELLHAAALSWMPKARLRVDAGL